MVALKQQSNSPGMNFGQLDAQNITDGTAVNLFQGNLSMPLEIISLPGLNDLNCDINLIYQSQVTEKVDQWNLEDISSSIGMGWDLSIPRIIKEEKSNSSSFDDRFYLIEQGNPTRLIANSKSSSQQIEYELENYQFHCITYFPKLEKWEIKKEDGTIYIYGGQGDENTLQWGIKWKNWIGPSLVTENQERYVKAWNLAKVENIYGNYYSLSYKVKEQSVGTGTLKYTKECMVSQIKNDLEWYLNFNYQPKTYDHTSLESPKEYLDPYRDPQLKMTDSTFSDAFQSCYLSMYLESVSLSNQNNLLVTTVQFNYYDLTNLTSALPENATARQRLNYGATYKRYLKSVERHYPNGESKPGTEFIYNFTTQKDEPRGALEKIIYSSGGQSLFNYKKILVGANNQEDPGSRNISIPNPFGQTQSAKPRIWYGQDYTISTWYNEDDNELRLNVFTWVGHWCISQTEWWTFEGIIDLDKLQLAISDNCFCLAIPYTSTSYNTELFLFNRDHLKPTVWTKQTQVLSFDTTKLRISNGENFFLIYDADNKILSRYFWHPFKRVFIRDSLSVSTNSDDYYFMSAYSNYYILYRYNVSDKNLNQFTIYYLDELYNWQQGGNLADTIYVPSISSSRYCEFGLSESFAAVVSITKKREDDFDSELKILMWNADFSDLHFANLEEPWGEDRSPFTYLPIQMMPYLGPMAIQNSVVASGPNAYIFNGQKWEFQTVGIKKDGSFKYPEDQFYWYAFQRSGLLKTENTESGILSSLRYPNQENSWNEIPIIAEYDESSQSKRVKEAYPTFVNNYLTADKYIYSNPFNQDWQNIKDYLIAELEVEENLSIDTTTLINQAPNFIAFMTVDEDGQPHDTRIGFFQNGDLIRTPDGQVDWEILPNQQINKLLNKNYEYRSSLNGQLPAISQGFVTYSTETTLNDSTAIILHHYANQSLQDPIETFVINQMISNSGYNKVSKCYEYENVSAAQDSTQTIIRFQKVTEYQGCLEPKNQTNGYTISYFANGLPDLQNEVSIPSALDGILLKKEQYDSVNNLMSFTETESEILTQIPKSWTSSSFRPLFGAFVQTKSKTTMLDGVSTRMDFEYFVNTGRVRQTETSYWNSQGQKITEQNIFTYGCEKYDLLKQQNRLSEIVQMTIQTKTDIQENYQINYSKVQTYTSWVYENKTYWAEFKEYFSNNATAVFDWTNDNISEEDWRCTKTIIERDEQGNVVQCEDTEKIVTTVQYDDIGRFPVASFRNASTEFEGFFYESFEPYQTCSMSFNNSTGGELYQQDCFVGTTCYKIDQSGILTKCDILPTGTVGASIYCLSAYLKTNIQNSSELKFQFTNGIKQISKIVSPKIDWFYFQWIVDLSDLKNTSDPVDIQLIVSLDTVKNEYVQLDQFSFRPINAQFSAELYDPNFCRQIASLANNGACDRIFYNQFQDQQSMIGAYENVLGFRTAFLTQQLAAQEDASFSTENPNMELIIRGQASGFYDTFKENALAHYNYIDCAPANWCVDQHKLQFLSSAEDKILGARVERQSFKSNNLAVCVYAPDVSAKSMNLGIGNFSILWNDHWNLVEQQDDQVNILEQNQDLPFGREWIFIAIQNRFAFFANGIKIFDFTLAQAEQEGTIKLGMQNSGSFEQLIVADQIEMDINYMDGLGNTIQTFRWESAQSSIVEGTVFDSCGRDAIQLKSTRVSSSSLSFLNNWVKMDDENLWKGEGIQGDINQYHPDDQGYPFEQEGYETSPLERVVKKGQPGKEFAITPTESHIQTIEYGSNPLITDFKYTLPENSYFLQTFTDADGARTHYYRDIAQHLIGVIQEGVNGNRYASWTYNENGDLIEAIPPNYYSGDMDESGISTYSYNFSGKQTQSSHPDSGEGRFIYDDASMVRIYQDTQTETDKIVNYLKYDSLGRLIEKGYLEQDWDLPTLETYAKNPNWPENGNWTIRYKYDGDESTPNMLGNLWQTQTANNESIIVETFSYDLLNCPITCQRTVDESLIIQLQSNYSCCGMLSKTSDNQTNLEVFHHYNPLGQLVELTSSVNQETISNTYYSYTASGLIQTLQIKNPAVETPIFERDFSYNSPEWLINLQDSSFSETLTYNTGAIGDSGYYTGKIASQSIKLNETDYGTSSFKVDQWNRLIQSQNASLEESWQIDLNNNFQSWTSNSITRIFETIENRNQVLSVQQEDQKTNYTYQLNGDIQSISNSKKSTQFSYYKGTSCLQTIENSDTKMLQFEYNGENLRATKTLCFESKITDQWFYLYNDSGKSRLIIHKTDSKMNPLSLNTHPFINILYDGENLYFALKDHLDSTRIILDTIGNICGQYDYTLYGKPTILQNPPISYNYLFTDHEYDVESGLYNMEVRLYDPTIGRFLMTDPKAEFFSPYVYVGNNPLIATDPTGRMSSKAIGWLALVVGVIASVATAGVADMFLAPAAAAALGVEGAAATAALSVGIEVTTSSVAGAFASQAVSAGASHEAFFTKSLGTSLLANIAGGLVGAGVGVGVGSAMKAAGSRASSKAISGASQKLVSKTTKKVAQTAVKEVAGNVADSLTNSTVNWAFGDQWNTMDGALIGISQLGVILPVGQKYRKMKQDSGTPVIGKSYRKLERELPAASSNPTHSNSTKSHKKPTSSSSPTNTSRLVRSNAMRKRTNPYSSKQTVNLSKSIGQYSKTRTFTKELQTDVIVSPREVLI